MIPLDRIGSTANQLEMGVERIMYKRSDTDELKG